MKFLASVILLAHLIAPFLVLGEWSLPHTIHISDGPVRGTMYLSRSEFLNIRYGEPPVGDRRFMHPVPTRPWTDVDALIELMDVNYSMGANQQFIVRIPLELNVFTPMRFFDAPSVVKRPVIVNFSNRLIDFSEHQTIISLVAHDITFVHVNYRDGVIGFLNMDHPNATGNQGLKDQVLALKWVQNNIAHFGGDPNRVTIMGIGAAAAMVGYHVLSSASAGLFHGAISMSGTPLGPNSFVPRAEAVHRGEALARIIVGYDYNTSLTKQSAMKILQAATDDELKQASHLLKKQFRPTLEDPSIAKDIFLSECITSIYESGTFNKVPQLIGFKKPGAGYRASGDYEKKILSAIDEVNKRNDARALNPYKPLDIWLTIMSSRIRHTVQLLMANNDEKPVYYYEEVPNALTIGVPSDPVVDVMHWNDIGGRNIGIQTPLDVYNLIVRYMWVNFAENGNPERDNLFSRFLKIHWPAVGSTGQALQISDALKVVPFEPPRFSLPNVCDVQ